MHTFYFLGIALRSPTSSLCRYHCRRLVYVNIVLLVRKIIYLYSINQSISMN